MHANVANNTIMAADVQTEEEKTQPMACLNRGFSINPQSMECECKTHFFLAYSTSALAFHTSTPIERMRKV